LERVLAYVLEGPVNDGYTLKKGQLKFLITGPSWSAQILDQRKSARQPAK
jgi:hypothetical protein